jgi:hypothetical protein
MFVAFGCRMTEAARFEGENALPTGGLLPATKRGMLPRTTARCRNLCGGPPAWANDRVGVKEVRPGRRFGGPETCQFEGAREKLRPLWKTVPRGSAGAARNCPPLTKACLEEYVMPADRSAFRGMKPPLRTNTLFEEFPELL